MDWWLVTFVVGALLSLFLTEVPALFFLILLIVLALRQFFVSGGWRYNGLLLGACCILLAASLHKQRFDAAAFVDQFKHQQTHQLDGQVVNLITNNKQLKLKVKVFAINNDAVDTPYYIRLSWKNPKVAIKQGQHWRWAVKLKPRNGLANPGGFSYQNWLLRQQIVATGYVKADPSPQLLANAITWRQSLFDALSARLKMQGLIEFQPFITALSLGDKSLFLPEHWLLLLATQTQHVFAISGLHLGLVVAWLMLILACARRYWPLPLSSCRNWYLTTLLLAMFAAVVYAALAGFSPPTLRALIMLAWFSLASLLALRLSLTRWLLLTVVTVLILQPFALFEPGFWLSMIAVSIVLLALRFFFISNHQQSDLKSYVGLLVKLQLILLLSLTAVNLVMFSTWSVAAIAANIVVIPLMACWIIPACLLATLLVSVPLVSDLLLWLAAQGLKLAIGWLYSLEQLQWSWQVEHSGLFLLLSISALIVWYCRLSACTWKKAIRLGASVSGCIFSAFLIQTSVSQTSPRPWHVTVLDVGQGLAVVIEKGGRAVVYDTGASFPSGFNTADAVLIPYLQHRQISAPDQIFISHSDNDHAGGLTALTQVYPNSAIIANRVEATRPCLADSFWQWQGLQFQTLWPQRLSGNDNDDSCVLLISDGQHQVLLTGDISKRSEHALLAGNKLSPVSLLVVPHHGSKTSSAPEFIAQVKPQVAIASTGYLNRWQLPSSTIKKRYYQAGAAFYSTAESGAITVTFFADKLSVNRYRQEQRPMWWLNI